MTATDVDVFERSCWLDSHGNGTKLVHAVTCRGVGLDSSEQCRSENKCTKRYAAASLDKGQVSKLKRAMIEQLGKHSDKDRVEQRGNPVASPLVRGYLAISQEEQRRGGVSVMQPPLLVVGQLRELDRNMRRRVPSLPTAAERFAMVRDVASFCVAFHTMKRGLELSVAVAAQVLQMSGGEGFIFNFLFGKTLRESSQAVVVRRKILTVATSARWLPWSSTDRPPHRCSGPSWRVQVSCSRASEQTATKGIWR